MREVNKVSKVKDGNYVVIQSFMVKELGLKGNELLIYAVIYGFSQDCQRFSGSLQYLADWTNTSKQSVLANLKRLCDKNLILKFDVVRSGVKFCEYQTIPIDGIKESLIPIQKSLTGGVQKSLTNNLEYDNLESDNQEDMIDIAAHAAPRHDYKSFKDIFNSTCTKLSKCMSITEPRKRAIEKFLKEYTLEQWQDICTNANVSDFLTGKNDRGWKADIDFLLRIDKATKALEGGYANKDYRDKYKEDVPEQSSTEEYGFEFGY